MAHASLSKYRQVTVSSVKEMNPYEQINLIFSNIIGKLAAAKGFMERKEIEKKGGAISDSIVLLGALQDTLNMEEGGEISANLMELYNYCKSRLVIANTNNDPEILTEVSDIIKEIKQGWDGIPNEQRNLNHVAQP